MYQKTSTREAKGSENNPGFLVKPGRTRRGEAACLGSEQAEDAEFGAEALVVVVLGVGLAFFLDQDQLGAEAEEGEGAVEERDPEGLGELLAFRGPRKGRQPK